MEVTRILTADINDIIFDGRNKDYGAYELRKTYHYRLKSMAPVTRERIYTKPLIMDDKDIKENERPPEISELNDVKIGVKNIESIAADVVVPPGEIVDKGIIEAPVKEKEDPDKIFIRVEKESEYPGGKAAWMRYLLKTFRYPQEAQENGVQGSVIVQFIVNREGYVSDVTVIDGPRELWDEAIRVISKSGQWTPAIQNGRQVKSYKKQSIVFKLEE